MANSARIDATMVAQLQELLGERFGELIERFIEDGERRITLLRGAVVQPDFDVVHAEAHGLKGSSRNIGANDLGTLCGDLEQLGKEHNALTMPTLFAAVEQEFAAVCAELKTY
jgi:HPt (histidine-containing phosphotransfer) domain-containing protein